MKILVVTLGSIGDLLPFIVVGTALRGRGHQVIFASNAGYEALVRSAGFPFHAIWDRAPSQPNLDDVLASDPEEAWRRVQRDLFMVAEKPAIDFIAREAGGGNCAILASWSAYGASRAHERLALPLCSVYLSPQPLFEDSTGANHSGVSHSSASHSSVSHSSVSHSGAKLERLGFFPDWFCPLQPGWPEVALSGFPMFADEQVPALPAALEHFLSGGKPPVVVTPGSFARGAAAFFRESLAACTALGLRAVLLTPYAEQVPTPLPPTAIHFKYVSLQNLLGRAAALVCHGGIGTLAQGLKAGIPQLVTPGFFDQRDNAHHIETLGTGAILAPGAYTADAAAGKISQLLRSDTVRRNCTRIRDRFRGKSPIGEICERIEALA